MMQALMNAVAQQALQFVANMSFVLAREQHLHALALGNVLEDHRFFRRSWMRISS